MAAEPPSNEMDAHPSSWLIELVSHAPLMMTVRDPSTDRWVWVSSSLSQLTGKPQSELIGARMGDVLPPKLHQLIERCETEAFQRGGEPVPLSGAYSSADGRRGHFDGVSFAIHTYGGRTLVGSVVMDVTDLVVAQGRAQHLLDHLPIMLSTSTSDGRLLSLDGALIAAHKARGLTRPGHIDDLVVEGDPAFEPVWRLHREALAGHTAVGRFVWNGRWQEARCAPLTEDGEITGVVTITADVDEQVRADEARRISEARFEMFMRHSPAAVVTKDGQGRYTWANSAYFDTYRVSPQDFAGKTIYDLTGPEVADYATALDQKVVDTGKPLRDTHRYVRSDGSTGVDLGFRFPIPLPDGATGLGGVFIDVTELHETRTRARQAEARYRTLFDRSPVPMLVADASRRILDANPAFSQLVAMPLRNVRGLDIATLTDRGGQLGDTFAAVVSAPPTAGTSITEWYVNAVQNTRTECETTLFRVPEQDDEQPTVVVIVRPSRAPVTAFSETDLTSREAAVLELRAAGHSIAHIASRVDLTNRGVDYYLSQLAKKLDTTTTNLVARAFHLGILGTDSWPPRLSAAYQQRTWDDSAKSGRNSRAGHE